MEIQIQEIEGTKLALVKSNETVIQDVQDALDVLANCGYHEAFKIIINQENITPDFFDLKTGIAGEVLQKFSNYRMQLAIVGDFSKYSSKSLRDFIFESNKAGRIIFVSTLAEAQERLSKN